MALADFVLEHAPDLKDRIVRRNVRDVVAGKIANLIASGLLTVGDDLPGERDLAAALQVSRESVRGGIQILATRGILAVVQGSRTRVASDDIGPDFRRFREQRIVNQYSLGDVHAARLLVERPVVEAAASQVDAEVLAFLHDCLETQRGATGDPVRFLISDREFHLAIYNACGNATLAEFVGDLYGYMVDHRRWVVSEPGAIEKSVADHEAIVAALERRDGAETVRAFEIHLQRIYETTRLSIDRSARSLEREPATGRD